MSAPVTLQFPDSKAVVSNEECPAETRGTFCGNPPYAGKQLRRPAVVSRMKTEMNLPAVNPSVIFQALPNGAVLFSPSEEIYFGLNEVGAQVWQLLPSANGSIDTLCTMLHARYPDVDMDTIRQDVTELLDDLVRQGLAVQSGEPDAAARTSPAS